MTDSPKEKPLSGVAFSAVGQPILTDSPKPKLAVYKFSSCDGCQLSLLGCEDELLDVCGAVEIASPDAGTAPRIQPNSLATEEDRAQAIRVSQVLRALATTPTIASLTEAPKPPDIIPMTEPEMLDNFRARATTNFHPTCTCRMGRDRTTSVVDARLKVHGIGGLRVVDASAFPNITSGNTNAPTMMLAMRAAELILEDARQA